MASKKRIKYQITFYLKFFFSFFQNNQNILNFKFLLPKNYTIQVKIREIKYLWLEMKLFNEANIIYLI